MPATSVAVVCCWSTRAPLPGSIDRAVGSIEGLHIPQIEKQRIFSGTALGG